MTVWIHGDGAAPRVPGISRPRAAPPGIDPTVAASLLHSSGRPAATLLATVLAALCLASPALHAQGAPGAGDPPWAGDPPDLHALVDFARSESQR